MYRAAALGVTMRDRAVSAAAHAGQPPASIARVSVDLQWSATIVPQQAQAGG
jgi:hypothetical protein